VAIIRMTDAGSLIRIAEAIAAGGISAVEITMTTPGALDAVAQLAGKMGGKIRVGVGSVLDEGTVHDAVRAGAQYIVSPVFKPEMIREAHALDVPCIPGCYTPTEMQAAWEADADIIKVFPADIGGPAMIRNILAPMPYLPLMPAGGVTTDNAREWIAAGACCLGAGSALLDKKAIAEERFGALTRNAETLKNAVETARRRPGASIR
jgi:2-dehydro-3-deoxyphosphogluconate aldolase/(4S)-4-hydroxy-2-oxoglutarate aldolase